MDATDLIAGELVTLVRGLKDLLGSTAREQGLLDPPAFAVLARVGESRPLRLSALAEGLFVDVSTVSRQLSALERAGLVVRERDPDDGRAFLLRLSAHGEEVLHRNRVARAEVLRRLLADWTEQERSDLAAHLARFNAAVTAARTPAVASQAATVRSESS